ncbi:DJ-1/PfpI family protein [Tuwongella immobilis]|uniref:DJ-1/PfpI domain-containing protein n=1 Tax=Tuwongella immobilis TaxID=692036 RepID=A0A6C2YPD4_9BACT|nr:DJ-1/PfpI family protein [Tuwongella immobilis]VIP03161.1 ThiJ/PfpI domain-containing protein OS=Microcoleus vaginatus FGP-2 GN=MicvaDRAFT_5098 PE=4 SV=1: DUF4066 [Tuwongella immobilis]VTS03570.1 ThiJ/PfpI domain-containing protein OS=Microcoleus vaginatus FGP-2 GN=MicvaDRAFT_5098 PE=4 SV=1: DUF4066 [Tuwongella immobilis]
MTRVRLVAIILFEEVEVLDFAGPFEVFSVTGRAEQENPFEVKLVAETMQPVLARKGFSVNPHLSYADCPQPDILIIPGGYGTRREVHNPATLEFVKKMAPAAEIVLSVCTGSLILGKLGLLDGKEATTHHLAFDFLKVAAPKAILCPSKRVIDTGHLITSGGISSGIDASIHVVNRLLGERVARETATYMEYPFPNLDFSEPAAGI